MTTSPAVPLQATPEQHALWLRLQAYAFGPDADALPAFERRVAQQAHCSVAVAQHLVEEYRRFCFLACTSTAQATPSPLVDQVWHTHLTDTREYWDSFCPQVLQATLHHQPGRGSAAEDARFQQQYRATLERYELQFGAPPALLWPAPRPAPTAVPAAHADASEAALRALRGEPAPPSVRRLPRAVMGWALAAAVAAWLAYSANGGIPQPLQWRGVHFLPFFITLIALGWSTAAWLRRALRGGHARAVDAVDASEFAYLSGGADRVADLLFTELLVRNAVYLDRDEDAQARRWVRWQPRIAVPPALEPALQALRSAEDPTVAWQALRGLAGPVRQQLIDKGLWLAPGAARRVRVVSTLPVAVVWVLGACKLVIGVQGGYPVGYLLGCMVLTSVLVLGFLLVPVRRTLAGDARLQARRQAVRRDAARTGADPGEAVALYGTVALVGTPWASYHEIRAPNTHHHDSTGSSCGGGGGGDGGDGGGDSGGDGGGGCGGCGGGGD